MGSFDGGGVRGVDPPFKGRPALPQGGSGTARPNPKDEMCRVMLARWEADMAAERRYRRTDRLFVAAGVVLGVLWLTVMIALLWRVIVRGI